MSKAMEDIRANEEHNNLMRLADAQERFVGLYADRMPEYERNDFRRDFLYVISLAYREAQVPLTKQLTEVIMMQNRPIILEKP